jgi:hypothetical protein
MTLDQFVDELIRRAAAHRYVPTTFIRMRADYGTVSAIRKLVETSEPQSGFRRLKELGMLDWSLESAVLAFPCQFTAKTIKFARARLDGTLDA